MKHGINRKDLLPGIPLVESPLFPVLAADGVFGAHRNLAEHLHHNGYAVLDLGRERIGALAAEIRSALADQLDLEAWRRSGGQKDLRVQDAWREVEAVRALALEPLILEVLETLWGRKPFAFQTLNFPVGTQQHLHSMRCTSTANQRDSCAACGWHWKTSTPLQAPWRMYPEASGFPISKLGMWAISRLRAWCPVRRFFMRPGIRCSTPTA